MEFIKKHKVTIIILTILLIAVIIFGIWFYNILFPHGDAYGNRLDGIENVEITQDKYNAISSKIKEITNVVEVVNDIKGKVITFTVDIIEGGDINLVCDHTVNTLNELLTEEEKAFYDLQIIVSQTNEDAIPVIGYKQNASDAFVWTNNR